MDAVRAEKVGDTLRLYLDSTNFTRFSTRRLQADITMPVLTALEASGGSRLTIGGFKSDKPLSVNLSGGSTLDGDIEAGTITMDGSGGSRTTLSGKGSDLKIDGSGGSRFELGELPVDRAKVELSGGANATVDAQELDYDLSGGSQLRYQGEPVIGQKNTSGGAGARPAGR